VTGTVTLGGTSNLVIDSVSGLTAGETLFIVENDGNDPVTGTFAGLANGATSPQTALLSRFFMTPMAREEATISN
jgi:hypothetical protein